MQPRIAVFEDLSSLKMYPLTLMKPVYLFKTGWRDHWEYLTAGRKPVLMFMRKWLEELYKWKLNVVEGREDVKVNPKPLGPFIALNGRLLDQAEAEKVIDIVLSYPRRDVAVFSKNTLIAVRAEVNVGEIAEILKHPEEDMEEHIARVCRIIDLEDVEMLSTAGDVLKLGLKRLLSHSPKLHAKVSEIKRQVYVEDGAEVSDLAHFDTSNGPVFVERGAKIGAYAEVTGPALISRSASLKPHTKVRESIIGEESIVWGYVESTLIQGHFVSEPKHVSISALLCEYVCAGAGSKIREAIIGDFSYIAPGTEVYKDALIGPGCLVYGYARGALKPFTYVEGEHTSKVKLEQLVKLYRKILYRHYGRLISDHEIGALKHVRQIGSRINL